MIALKIILKRFLTTLLRYPVPIVSGLLAFVFLFIEIHYANLGDDLIHDYRFVKLFLECLSGISIFIAFDIFSESKQVENSKRLGLYLLGFSILGLHYYSITPGMFDSETVFISRYLIFIVCFHLMISFMAFYHVSEINAFWQYNYFLLKRMVTSLLYSVTLFVGLASAMWAIDNLFSILINPDYYVDLAAFILLIFNTIFFLMGMPKSYEDFNRPVEFKKSVRIFVQYVLLPIIAIYISILYVYMFKIVMTGQVPNGYVCIPILIFSMVGILAYLLIYPIRLEQRYRLIYLFAKYFFYILLPLLSLYFIGIMKRILPYGITEDRYLVFMLGVWIIIISMYIITSKLDNIIVVPVSLFILLAISAIGPWGMFQLSVGNQLMRLEHLLKRNHLLVDHKLVKLDKRYTVSTKDAASIRSIFTYLNKRGEINLLHPWLNEADQTKLDSAIAHNDLFYIHSIFSDLGPVDNSPYVVHKFFNAAENNLYNHAISVEGFKRITQFGCTIHDLEEGIDSTRFTAYIQRDTLYFQSNSDSLFSVPLAEKFISLINYYKQQSILEKNKLGVSNTLQVVNADAQNIELPKDSLVLLTAGRKIIFNSIEFIQADTNYTLQRVDGFLLE
ncbi:MAG: DUF4153 domain-containing protein [Bacteroidetes bacterium]|nr:DUF4153 domain-containing protein [Bacteroidota bacterium]